MSEAPPPGSSGWGPPGQQGQPPQQGQPGQPYPGPPPAVSPWGTPPPPQGAYPAPGTYGSSPAPYGQPPAPPSGGRSKLPLILAGVGLLVVAGIVALLLGLRGGSGSSSESPKDVAEKFLSAVEHRDCPTAYSLISPTMKIDLGTCKTNPDNLVPPKGTTVSFGPVTVKDETSTKATATVDATISGRTSTFTLNLVKQNGAWKIDKIG